jgi:hypothetical protein
MRVGDDEETWSIEHGVGPPKITLTFHPALLSQPKNLPLAQLVHILLSFSKFDHIKQSTNLF